MAVEANLLGSMAGWQKGGDCDTCVHEHKNWGNNPSCKECRERRRLRNMKQEGEKNNA